MSIRFRPLAIALLLLASCTQPQMSAEEQFIENATAALGGGSAIESVNTLTMEGNGRLLNLGQDLTPEATTMEFEISAFRLSADLNQGSSRTELTRTPLFDYFRGRDPMSMRFGFDGNIAYDFGPDGSARRSHDDVAADRRSTYYHHPLPLLRAVLSGKATLGNVRNEGGFSLADITTHDDQELTIAMDATTGFPAYISSTDHHFYLRDVHRKTMFSDYTSVGELTLPSAIRETLDEFQTYRLQVTAYDLNAQIGDISAPAEAASASPVSGSPPANVSAEQLDDGVWFMAGQSHHSVLIEFDDHLMLVEVPNEVRTLAVLAKADELFPDKPVTQAVTSHHHLDHSGGLRAAVSQGLTVITHAANETFYRRMAEQPSTIQPDALARSPRPIDIEVFDEQRTYEDETMSVELYHVADNPHSSSMLMVYLPKQRIIIQADAFTPGRTIPQLFAPNLLDNIERYGLEVDRIVPIHGGVADFSALQSTVADLRD